ncbi:MAG: PAS domain S-box protein [Microcoleus sp.]
MSQSLEQNQPINSLTTEDDRPLLSARDKQSRAVFETVLDAIAIADDEGRYLDVNPAACKLFGLDTDELLGRCISDFTERGADITQLWQQLPQPETARGELCLVRADGEIRTVEYAVTANFLPQRHLLVMRDITDCKRSQAQVQELTRQLAQERAQLRSTRMEFASPNVPPEYHHLDEIARHIPGVLYQFRMRPDGSFHFPYASKKLLEIYAVSPKEVSEDASALFKATHPKDFDRVHESILDSATHLTPWYCEYRSCLPDGRVLWLRGSSTPQREADGSIIWYGYIRDITDIKTAEADTQRLLAILETTSDLIATADVTGKAIYLNQAWRKFLNHDEDAIASVSISNAHPQWVLDRIFNQALPEATRCGIWRGETALLNPTGGEIPVSLVVLAHKSKEGTVEHFSAIMRDITETKATEAELTALFNAIQDVIIVMNVEGRCLKIAGGSSTLLYRPSQELLGKTLHEVLPKNLADTFLNGIHQAIITQSVTHLEYSLPLGDRLLWFDARISPMSQERVVLVARDITDRKRQEQALRLIVEGTAAKTGEEFFKSCVQYLAQALQVRYACISEFVNSEKSIATTLAFWGGDDFGDNFTYNLCGTPCHNLYRIAEVCRYPNLVQCLFPEDDDLVTLQAESYAGLPIVDAAGNRLGLLAVLDTKPMVQDIEMQSAILKIFATRAGAEMERMQAEAALRRSSMQLRLQSEELAATLNKLQHTQTQLIQSEKMSSLGQLVAGIAHEINNPVSFIYGNLQPASDYAIELINVIHLYQKHYPSPPKAISDFLENIDFDYLASDFSKLLESMKTGATRIRDIVKSLRTFSRLDEADLKKIDIHENMDSTLMILQNRFNARVGKPEIKIAKNYSKLPLIECYGGLLNQVFMNLLINAIDAIEQRQENLEISAQLDYIGQITITTFLAAENVIYISVQDNGCGMTPEVQEKIFNPFFTTKPIGKGTGMGLATSYQIVTENHRGNLRCSSTPGEGTELAIELPIYELKA